jgi:prevent-host-death family protein
MAEATAELKSSAGSEQLSEVIRRVVGDGERVVITRDGERQVAIIPLADLERLRELDRQRATLAVENMRSRAADVGADQLSDNEIEAEVAASRGARRHGGH